MKTTIEQRLLVMTFCALGSRNAATVVVVSVCAAQSHAPTPAEIEAIETGLRADVRGTEDVGAPRQPHHGPAADGRPWLHVCLLRTDRVGETWGGRTRPCSSTSS
jgi:hypothetical protein